IYYALAGNIAINNCFNIKAIHAAVGNPEKEGTTLGIPIIDYTIPSSFGSLELQKKENTEFVGQDVDYDALQAVPLIAIDSLELERIDFAKIDVEGMEMDVLKGAMNSIEKFNPVLLIEVIKSNSQEIVALLTNLGYQVFGLGINILAIHRDDPILDEIKQKL
ncbi:MAG: FkbM family methyltransferase, partial [Helicobacter sp.]|nr:FkbM family methyltransferase [Helicobacter sp.]